MRHTSSLHTQTCTWGGSNPLSLVLTTKRNCLSIATAGTRYSVLGLLAPLAPSHGCIHRVFRSSFTGPRFWHGGVMLQWAEFWLCSNLSHSGNAGRAVIEHQTGGTRFRRHSGPNFSPP